jgi:hypothetical protein
LANREDIVAIALLTRSDLADVGNALRDVLEIESGLGDFADLLAKIDEAEGLAD